MDTEGTRRGAGLLRATKPEFFVGLTTTLHRSRLIDDARDLGDERFRWFHELEPAAMLVGTLGYRQFISHDGTGRLVVQRDLHYLALLQAIGMRHNYRRPEYRQIVGGKFGGLGSSEDSPARDPNVEYTIGCKAARYSSFHSPKSRHLGGRVEYRRRDSGEIKFDSSAYLSRRGRLLFHPQRGLWQDAAVA